MDSAERLVGVNHVEMSRVVPVEDDGCLAVEDLPYDGFFAMQSPLSESATDAGTEATATASEEASTEAMTTATDTGATGIEDGTGSFYDAKATEHNERKRSSSFSPEQTEAMAKKLKEAKIAGRVARRRVTGTCLAVGTVGFVGSLVTTTASSTAWLTTVCAMAAAPSMVMLLAAVLPTDKKLVYHVTRLFGVLSCLTATGLTLRAVRVSTPAAIELCMSEYETVSRWYCGRWLSVYWFIWGMVPSTVCVVGGMRKLLRQPPRSCLNGLWVLVGTAYLGLGMMYTLDIFVALMAGCFSSDQARALLPYQIAKTTNNLLWGVAMAFERLRLRQRLQAALLARGGEVSSAAGIAALMGSHSPQHVKDTASRIFYGATLEAITYDHIAENTPNPELFKLASHQELGSVDWFISHSWRDPAEQKWKALQGKRRAFTRSQHHEPVIWFDKVCIDQNNIEDTLMCLPVFLSGCKSLLILCGPTYLERLWCMMELFVYLEMGASIDDVELCFIHPALGENSEAAQRNAVTQFFEEKFDDFDIFDAQCFDPVQRDQLLGIIEAGFGSLLAFNNVLTIAMENLRQRAISEIRHKEPNAAADSSFEWLT